MIVEFDPDARSELFRGSDFYENRRPGYGIKFIWAVEQATSRIAETPNAGGRWPGTPPDPPIRRRVIPGFPAVTVAYAVLPDRVYVLALVHERRAPGYWFKRIQRLERNRGGDPSPETE